MINLQQGDCLELMKDIPDGSVNMILCDLPYGVTGLKWDQRIDANELFSEYKRIAKETANIVLFGTNPFASTLIKAGIDIYKYEIVWKKSNGGFAYAKYRPLGRHELILVFGSKNSSYYPQMTKVKGKVRDMRKEKSFNSKNKNLSESPINPGRKMAYSADYDPRYVNPIDVVEFSNHFQGKNKFHPTQKPVPLLEYLIKTYTNEGEVVLDNCMGSGSTGVAAVNLNRSFIGMELDYGYFKIAEQRINEVSDN